MCVRGGEPRPKMNAFGGNRRGFLQHGYRNAWFPCVPAEMVCAAEHFGWLSPCMQVVGNKNAGSTARPAQTLCRALTFLCHGISLLTYTSPPISGIPTSKACLVGCESSNQPLDANLYSPGFLDTGL